MSCCGGKRAAARTVAPMARPMGVTQVRDPVRLALAVPGSLVVRGSATGLTYTFHGRMPQQVDGADAGLLLKTGRFQKR